MQKISATCDSVLVSYWAKGRRIPLRMLQVTPLFTAIKARWDTGYYGSEGALWNARLTHPAACLSFVYILNEVEVCHLDCVNGYSEHSLWSNETSEYNRLLLPDIYLFSLALQPPLGPGLCFQFHDHFTDGRTPWTSDQPVARLLPKHRTTQTQNKHMHTRNIHALCGIRTHDPSFRASEDSTWLRPLGYCDRPRYLPISSKFMTTFPICPSLLNVYSWKVVVKYIMNLPLIYTQLTKDFTEVFCN
jgi:hypothetical protein